LAAAWGLKEAGWRIRVRIDSETKPFNSKRNVKENINP
jgi:hypothetical protein